MEEKTINGEQYGNDNVRTVLTFKNEPEGCIFENCVFANCDINCQSPYIEFYQCSFTGDIKIHNDIVGEDDQIMFFKATADRLKSMKATSISISMVKSDIEIEELVLEGTGVDVVESSIKGNVIIDYHDELVIKNSNLKMLKHICSNKEANVTLDNSIINGQMVNFTNIEDEEKERAL